MDADALRRMAGQTGFDVSALEKDYALTWLLRGIYTSPLADVLIFKGGTAIRKVYEPEWRLSEDLDFTVTEPTTPEEIKRGFTTVFRNAAHSGIDFGFSQFHGRPYYVQARVQFLGPLGHKNTIKLDVSMTEKLVAEPTRVPIKPGYGVPGHTILAYAVDEILVEKIRSILQRGFARDYYDVWRLLKERKFETKRVHALLVRKCELTGVRFDGSMLFQKAKLAEAERHWTMALARLAPDLPPFQKVVTDLKKSLARVAQG